MQSKNKAFYDIETLVAVLTFTYSAFFFFHFRCIMRSDTQFSLKVVEENRKSRQYIGGRSGPLASEITHG